MSDTLDHPVTRDAPRFDYARVRDIRVVYNPRRHFDETAHKSLVADIANQGVLTPILVRPDPEGDATYILVAGERRLRAAREALGEDGVMPVYVRDLTAEEAISAATSENEVRQDVSETEQADAAVRLLDLCKGDRAEAARRLGWSTSKFDRRHALSKLSDEAKAALDERRILVGHAEILAAVPADKQNRALLTITSNNLSVTATRDLLQRMSHQLSAAIFDKTECQTCQYNASLQRTLFGTTVSDGSCTNGVCYDLKTQQEIRIREEHAAAERAEQDRIKAAAAPAPETIPAQDSPTSPATATPAPPQHDAGPTGKAPKETQSDKKDVPRKEPTDAERRAEIADARRSATSKSVHLMNDTMRTLLARHLAKTPSDATAFLVSIAYTDNNLPTEKLVARAPALLSKEFAAAGSGSRLKTVLAMPEETIANAQASISAGLALSVSQIDYVYAGVDAFNLDIRTIWRVDKSFLDRFTKRDLQVIAEDCGLTDHLGAKAFSRLLSGKRDEVIKAFLNTPNFSWENRLPGCMTTDDRPRLPATKKDADTDTSAPRANETGPSDNGETEPAV